MTRVLLVRPDDSSIAEIVPPLGLLYIASSLRRDPDVDVRLADIATMKLDDAAVADIARDFKPDVVGFSALSVQWSAVWRLSERLAEAAPGAAQVAGGAYATSQPDHPLKAPHISYAVAGEGEEAFPALVRALAAGGNGFDVPGVSYKDGDRAVVNPSAPVIQDLDALPHPAYDMIDFDNLSVLPRIGQVYRHKKYFTVFTSRGCPYKCSYCHVIFGKQFRFRSTENVIDELALLHDRYGVREIQFVDDIFNLRKDRAIAILRGIVERGWDMSLTFPNGLRADVLDEEIIDWMVRAGTYKVGIAIESASKRVQKSIRKNMRLEKAKEAIRLFAQRGVVTTGFFMMGFPGETEEEMRQTAAFARSTDLHVASFFYVQPLPGTELSAQLRALGGNVFANENLGDYYDSRVAQWTMSEVPPATIKKIRTRAFVRFYANPVRLWHIARTMPQKKQLLFLFMLLLMRTFRSVIPVEKIIVKLRRLRIADPLPAEA